MLGKSIAFSAVLGLAACASHPTLTGVAPGAVKIEATGFRFGSTALLPPAVVRVLKVPCTPPPELLAADPPLAPFPRRPAPLETLLRAWAGDEAMYDAARGKQRDLAAWVAGKCGANE